MRNFGLKRQTVQTSDCRTSDSTKVGPIQTSDWYKRRIIQTSHWMNTNVGLRENFIWILRFLKNPLFSLCKIYNLTKSEDISSILVPMFFIKWSDSNPPKGTVFLSSVPYVLLLIQWCLQKLSLFSFLTTMVFFQTQPTSDIFS